ncbi:hypothetical protein HWV62_13441 [Athelia sp. TMB]|nr:hypothetical protein HWV62_13441 [Athelia sp. TMB]
MLSLWYFCTSGICIGSASLQTSTKINIEGICFCRSWEANHFLRLLQLALASGLSRSSFGNYAFIRQEMDMPKRRVPKHNAPPIEITKPNQFNNGNIEVIQPQASSAVQSQNKVTVDEVLINGRRYRVPERVIMLDFWSKISSDHNPTQLSTSASQDDAASEMSSPLTSLSSLEDLDDDIPPVSLNSITTASSDADVLAVAQLLCSLRAHPEPRPALPNGIQATSNSMDATSLQPASTQNGIERPKRAMPVKRVASQATPNSSSGFKPTAAGPSPASIPALTKRLSRIRVKPEPEETTEIPTGWQKEPANDKIFEQKTGAKRGRKPKGKKEATKPKPASTMAAPALPVASASIGHYAHHPVSQDPAPPPERLESPLSCDDAKDPCWKSVGIIGTDCE